MKMKFNNDGFTSVNVLSVLLGLSFLAFTVTFVMKNVSMKLNSLKLETNSKIELNRKLNELIDSVSDSDLYSDAELFYKLKHLKLNSDVFTVTLKSLSDCLNPCFINSNDLKNFFPVRSCDLTDARYELEKIKREKLFFDISNDEMMPSQFSDKKLFTCISFANINSSDPEGIKMLLENLDIFGKSDLYVEKINNYRKLNKKITDVSELKLLFGIDFENVYPWINHCNGININEADPELIEMIAGKKRTIQLLNERKIHRIRKENLTENERKYFSDYTSFFELVLKNRHGNIRAVFVSIPDEKGKFYRNYLVEKQYEKK